MLRFRLVTVGLACAVVGCSDSSTAPTTPNVPDVSALLAEMAPASVSTASGFAAPPVPGAPNLSSSVDPHGCAYSPASGFFECPAVTLNGVTVTRRYQLLDRANRPQSKPDAQTFAIRTQSTVDGTVTVATSGQVPSSGSYTIKGSSDRTLSGIGTNTHALNGTSMTIMKGTLQYGTLTTPIDFEEQQTTSLILPNAKAGERWPRGTMTTKIGPAADQFVPTSTTTITFNGSSFVTITTSLRGGGTISCTFDLSKPPGSLPLCT